MNLISDIRFARPGVHGAKQQSQIGRICYTIQRIARLRFPRPIGRGLIEAGVIAQSTLREKRFPRPIGRGLIEAIRRWQGQDNRRDFRGQLAAASLKQIADLDRLSAAGHFRGQLAAASLKLGFPESVYFPTLVFPRPIGRGLIEAGRIGRGMKTRPVISAANWPRPH